MDGWSTLKKLIWLRKTTGGGGTPSVDETITGISPLVLAAALHKPIVSLKQTGVCEQAETPAPQELHTNAGTNTLIVTAEVSNIPFEATYKKEAA